MSRELRPAPPCFELDDVAAVELVRRRVSSVTKFDGSARIGFLPGRWRSRHRSRTVADDAVDSRDRQPPIPWRPVRLPASLPKIQCSSPTPSASGRNLPVQSGCSDPAAGACRSISGEGEPPERANTMRWPVRPGAPEIHTRRRPVAHRTRSNGRGRPVYSSRWQCGSDATGRKPRRGAAAYREGSASERPVPGAAGLVPAADAPVRCEPWQHLDARHSVRVNMRWASSPGGRSDRGYRGVSRRTGFSKVVIGALNCRGRFVEQPGGGVVALLG